MNAKAGVTTLAPLVLLACQATGPDDVRAHAEVDRTRSAEVAPVAAEEQGVWDYLRRRYDADGDARIVADEYDRGQERFDNLDSDGDGAITEADVDDSSGFMARMRGRGGPDRESFGARVFQRFFQMDDDPEGLALDELEESIDSADKNFDDVLSPEEFDYLLELTDAEAPSDQENRMFSGGRYEMLAAAVDEDEDGVVTRDELLAFFEERDDDGDGVVLVSSDRGGFDRERRMRERADTGVPAGEPAPDFTLPRLDVDGNVTLSDYAGDRPVALVFGSYT